MQSSSASRYVLHWVLAKRQKEGVDIRLYSIIYAAIEEVTAAMEGMLAPEVKEEIIGNVEVLDVFKISKVGTVAGSMVRDGKIKRSEPYTSDP